MILRLIRGRARREAIDELRAALHDSVPAGTDPAAGPLGWHLGSRGDGDDVDLLLVVAWTTAEAATRGDAREISPLSVARRIVPGLTVQHFEVDESLQRRSGAAPIALRVATGRFSRHGTDIEMQQLLRERLPTIGDEMCEAYVGRRIDGRAVEVTFVSLWARIPADLRLEDSFWTDIALRYDDFAVEVYATGG